MKKRSDFSRLMGYAGNYRYFTYASWDAYNSARLMETAYSPNFAADVEKAQAACYQEAPKIQGGLPLDVMKKLAALLQSSQPEPAMAV